MSTTSPKPPVPLPPGGGFLLEPVGTRRIGTPEDFTEEQREFYRSARKSSDEKHWILNGTKQWISNAGFADVFVVFAKVDGDKFSAFLVDRDSPGFTVGPEEHKMGLRGSSTCALVFDDARIPAENLLGQVGEGHRIAFNVLLEVLERRLYSRTIERSILNGSIARTACGIPAGIRTVSPVLAITRSPPMVSSTAPSSTCTNASNGAVCSESSWPVSKANSVREPPRAFAIVRLTMDPGA